MPKFKINDPVTGAPGRVSHGWHGVVKEIVKPRTEHPAPGRPGEHRESYTTPGGYMVWWKEREEHENRAVAKNPTIFMLEEQLTHEKNADQARQTPPAEDRVEAGEPVDEEDELKIGID